MQFEACLLLWSCWTKTYRWTFSFFMTSADLSTCLNHQFWKTRKLCSALWNTFVCYNQSVQCKAIPISVTSSLALQMGNLKSDNHVQLSSWVCVIIHVQRVKSCQASRACQKISSRLLRFKTKPKPWPTPSNLFCWRLFWGFMSKYTFPAHLKSWHTSYYFDYSFRYFFDDLMITILFCDCMMHACINDAVTVCFTFHFSTNRSSCKMKLPKPCGIALIISP